MEPLLGSPSAEEDHSAQRVSIHRIDSPTILVVGGDSTIGSQLFRAARARGLDVHKTSRRDSSFEYPWSLELGDESSTSVLMRAAKDHGVTDAVITVGQPSFVSCASDPSGTWAINVTATQQLVARLVSIGVNVMVISSGAVFSGRNRFPTEESACDPETEYGRQKVALEEAALAYEGTRIVRFSKVLSSSNGLWRQWIQEIQAGETVRAFGNVKLSPMRISAVVSAILKQFELPSGRIVHISPVDEVTYADAVRLMAQEMKLTVNLDPLSVHRDVSRGILPDRWTALGTVHHNPSLHIESSESAMRKFTRQVVGLPK